MLIGLLLKGLNFPIGKSALHWAAAVNNVEATLVLLKNGANRDMQDNKVQLCMLSRGVPSHMVCTAGHSAPSLSN